RRSGSYRQSIGYQIFGSFSPPLNRHMIKLIIIIFLIGYIMITVQHAKKHASKENYSTFNLQPSSQTIYNLEG
ncbi:MAG: hypothetical protein ACLFVX_06860, partial [Archaeoglobaceae archaeon]